LALFVLDELPETPAELDDAPDDEFDPVLPDANDESLLDRLHLFSVPATPPPIWEIIDGGGGSSAAKLLALDAEDVVDICLDSAALNWRAANAGLTTGVFKLAVETAFNPAGYVILSDILVKFPLKNVI